MTTVAFLGLGAIGAPMARRVALAGFPLRVWNRTAERATAFASATGATAARTPAEAVRGADVIITCLSTSRDVAALLDGPDGILAGASSGAVFADCTSGDPATSQAVAA
ncbi:MAG TPA: NAD(P)-binding domain-containing protein, partial [Gemmatimonadaceae bacterium]|nr:NAD(P)-binding domain-containing protein [Gemmatimonadaceae bacterium]